MYINYITSKFNKYRNQILAFILSLVASSSLIYYLHNKSVATKSSVLADIFGWLILETAYIFILYLYFQKKGQISRALFIFILIEISLFALKTRVLMPPVPFAVVDHYQDITVNIYEHTPPIPSHRASYYPLILLLSTYISGSFSAIIIVQILFSVLSIILFVFIILKTNTLISPKVNVLPKKFYYLISLIPVFLFLLSNRRIEYEFSIRPESISQFLEIAILFFVFKIIKNKKHFDKYLLALVILSIFSVFFQIKFIFLSIFNILIVLFVILSSKNILKKKINKILLIIIIPITAFLLLNSSLGTYVSNNAKKEFENNLFYVRNQKIIYKTIISDFDDANFNKYDKQTLKKFINYYNFNAHYYPDNDNISISNFDSISNEQEPSFINFSWSVLPDYDQRVDFFRYYIKKSMTNYPFDYLMSYFYELRRVYNPIRPLIFNRDYNMYFQKEISNAKAHFEEYYGKDNETPIIKNYLNQSSDSYYSQGIVGVFVFINPLRKIINFLYLPSLFIFAILFFTNWLISKKRQILFKKLGMLVLYSTIAAFLMYSVTCFGHLYLNRYTDEILPLFLASELFAITYIISTLLKKD